MKKHVVAPASELPPGTRRLVTVNGREIVVFNVKGEYFGLINRCPHRGGALAEGVLTGLVEASEPGEYRYSRQGEILRCPWHGWEFDIRTGQSWCDPRRVRARRFPVTVESGQCLVEGPYTAETVPVSVEESYIIVEL